MRRNNLWRAAASFLAHMSSGTTMSWFQSARRGLRRFVWLVPVLVAMGLGWFCWQVDTEVTLNVGAPTDNWYVRNFYGREQSNVGVYRWSAPEAVLRLPAVKSPAVLRLRMAGVHDDAAILVRLNRVELATLQLSSPQLRRYALLSTGPAPADGITRVELHGWASDLQDDPRALVALVESVQFQTLRGQSLPPLFPLLLLGLNAGVMYLLLRQIGIGRRGALFLALLAGAGLVLAWGQARIWVAPYLLPLALGGSCIVLVLVALRWGVQRRSGFVVVDVLGILTACTALIPLFSYSQSGVNGNLAWFNLPILLLPLGVLLLRMRGRSQRLVAGLILIFCGAYAAYWLNAIFRSDYATDFHAIYRGVASLVRDGEPLYNLSALERNPLGPVYKYPPTFALLFMPFAHLAFVPAIVAWRVINLGLLLLAATLLLKIYAVRLHSWIGVGMILLLCTLQPLADTLRYGQVDLLLLVLCVLGLFALMQQQDRGWGFWIGSAAMIKLYPAYLLALVFVQQRWKALYGLLGSALLLGGTALFCFGWAPTWTFLHNVLLSTGVGTTWVENQTFNGFLNRLLSPEQVALLPRDDDSIRVATYAWAIGLTVLTAWLTRPSVMRPDIAFGLWIVAMLLVLPVAWIHYQVLLLIPFFQLFILTRDNAACLSWVALASYALAWMLLSQGSVWTFFDRNLYGPFWQLLLSYKFYGLLLLYGAIALAGRRSAVGHAQPAQITLRRWVLP